MGSDIQSHVLMSLLGYIGLYFWTDIESGNIAYLRIHIDDRIWQA